MTPMTAEQAVVRLERTIPAPPHRVYRAWLEPDLAVRWMAPASFEATRIEVDERVGGAFRIWHSGPDGAPAGGFEAELLELVPDERIVFLWRFVGPERVADPAHDSRLTITLRAAPEGATALTLVHERLEAIDAAMPGMADAARVGWGQALDALAAAVTDAA
jgi:uncharacterized protein YndB with AHSA1/START domain